MRARETNGQIVAARGDLTKQKVDAIVNAANETLLGGGGVDGAIHRAAGPELLAECRTLGGCPTGEARITQGYRLPAAWVIHTVGPIWRGGGHGEDALLAQCYRSCFGIARERSLRTLAFPSISTGAYGFPVERASHIAVAEMRAALADDPSLREVRVVCFDDRTYRQYLAALQDTPA